MAVTAKDFCTCTDLKCPHHPANQDGGCDPCIRKNLSRNEIPSCFFKKVSDDPRVMASGAGFEQFARVVQAQRPDADA